MSYGGMRDELYYQRSLKYKLSQLIFQIYMVSKVNTISSTVSYYHVKYEFQGESTLYSLPECQRTPCSRQAPYVKFKWQQRDSIDSMQTVECRFNLT